MTLTYCEEIIGEQCSLLHDVTLAILDDQLVPVITEPVGDHQVLVVTNPRSTAVSHDCLEVRVQAKFSLKSNHYNSIMVPVSWN